MKNDFEKAFENPKCLSDKTLDVVKILNKIKSACKSRPGEDLLISLGDDGEPKSVQEVNDQNEEMIFLCVRCDSNSSIVPGSTKKQCSACNTSVWMSPGTELTMNKVKKTKIVCVNCLEKVIKDEK